MENHIAIPEWLLAGEDGEFPPSGRSKRKAAGFAAKTINDIAQVLKDEFFSGSQADRPGLLQYLDPRIKVATTAILILLAALLSHITALLLLNLVILWMAWLSGVRARFFLKRVWLFIPLFAGLIALPSVFNIFRPGTPLLVLAHFGRPLRLGPLILPPDLAVTAQGLTGAAMLVLRVGACVSLAALLTVTTRWSVLLRALGVLRIPRMFVLVLEMTYRYIFVLLKLTTEMFMARQSRTVGRTSTREKQKFVSSAISSLWGRSYAMSEEVYAAMLSRGYTGTVRIRGGFQTKTLDWVWLCFVILATIFFLGGDRLIGGTI